MNRNLALLALTGTLFLGACSTGPTQPTPPTQPAQPGATTGAVTFVKDAAVTATVRNSSGTVVTNLGTLTPGTYTVVFSREGFVSSSPIQFTITAGQTVNVTAPALMPVTTTQPTAPSGAFYMNAQGQMVAITQADLQNAGTRFVFYAWLEDEQGGVTPGNLAGSAAPTVGERDEVAPLNTQNLAAGYVGYRADDGTIYPVVGAGVRWDINEDKSQTNVRIATADDGALASGAVRQLDVNDNAMSATTFTNRATGSNPRFPSTPDYPLNNVTGVNTPDTNGFTWMALWVPSGEAGQATVTAVAEINGTEINKMVLSKRFAPSARLEIVKEANQTVGLGQDANFTVTVRNVGQGPATGVQLQDRLTSGSDDAYSITAPAGTTAQGDSGFNATFDLAAGESRTFTFPARSTAVGVFCDTATITGFTNGAFGAVTPTDLRDDACLTVQAPELTITKSLVDASGNPIASGQQVGPNQEVFAAITVRNGGNAAATNVVVTDRLTTQNAATYAIRTPAQNTTLNGDDGFTSAAFNLAAGESRTFRFGAVGTANGEYCDNGTFTATSNNGAALSGNTDNVCFTVVSPNLEITKVNQNASGTGEPGNLYPGSSYRSVITVTNTGTGAATALAVQDILGQLQGGSTFVNFGSGSYTIDGTQQTGQLAFGNNTVTTVPAALTLNAGQTLTLTLTSTIPAGAPAGRYCDVASFTSGNGGTDRAEACVDVMNFVSTQTQMTDTTDPIVANGTDTTILTSSLIVEPQSNEGVRNNTVAFNFGSTDPRATTAGVFNVTGAQVYYDPTPTRDPETGAVTSDFTNATSRLLTAGTEYTVASTAQGTQTVNLNFAIQPGGVVYFRHTVTAPTGTAPRQYFSGFLWQGAGINSGRDAGGASSEPTSVVNPQ